MAIYNSIYPKKELIKNIIDFWRPSGLSINKKTKIASMGSCFAREIKKYLLKNNYNYLLYEQDVSANRGDHASCAWERIYNTYTLRHIIDYSLNENWAHDWKKSNKNGIIQDGIRTNTCYNNLPEAESEFKEHRKISKSILEQTDILIITLGLIEVWQSNVTGKIFSIPKGIYVNTNSPDFFKEYKCRITSLDENIDNLEYVIKRITEVNSKVKILITVSPVPMTGSVRKNTDIFSSNCISKSTLRCVADYICNRYSNVSYFPSYEIATSLIPLEGGRPYMPDNIHVTDKAVEIIMDAFSKIHCNND